MSGRTPASFGSLLVLLDGDARCDARIHLAARLAAAHGSHLIGLAVAGAPELATGSGAAAGLLDEAAELRAQAQRRAAGWAEHFVARCRAEGAASVEADIYEGPRDALLLHHAHCADAVLIGQADPASASHREEQRFVEHVLQRNPRPTLVVPHAGRFDGAGRAVLVAWDDSHGSARALADALPLLRHASRVGLRVWRRAGEAAEQPIRERLAAVCCWLSRQGVTAEPRVNTSHRAVGDAILAGAAEFGADLIVMGSYGHSRWSERLLGGATRTALARSPIPLLMSH